MAGTKHADAQYGGVPCGAAAQHLAGAARGAPPQLSERARALAVQESDERESIAEEADTTLRDIYAGWVSQYPGGGAAAQRGGGARPGARHRRVALEAAERAERREAPRQLLLQREEARKSLIASCRRARRPILLTHLEAVLRDAHCLEEEEHRSRLPLRGDLRLIGARERERGAVRAAEAAARCALLAAAERSKEAQAALLAEPAARAELCAAEEGARAAAELRTAEVARGAAVLKALSRAEAAARVCLGAAARQGLWREELRGAEGPARAVVTTLEAAERALGGAALALARGEARRRGWCAQEEAYERRALRLLRISGADRRLGPGAGELEIRAAFERREREQLSVEMLAAVPQSAVGVAALREWLAGLAAEGGLGPGSGARGLGETLCFARLAAAETVEERDAAMAELGELLRRDPPELAALCGGGAAAAVQELPPDEDAPSPLPAGAAFAERAQTAAEAEGFAAKQQQGAAEPPPAAAAEPEAVRRRRKGLRPAFSERTQAKWRLAPAPVGRSMAEAAEAFATALCRAAGFIKAGFPAAVNSGAIDFILELPQRLAARLPGASKWLTDQHVRGTQVWRERHYHVWHSRERWVRRATGLLGVLGDVLTRAAEQVRWADENRLWDCPDRLGQLVVELKEDERLSAERLKLLVADAARDLRSFDALLRTWDAPAALELFVAGFLYSANLPEERFGLLPGCSGAGGKADYQGPPDGKKNQDCQIYHVWNQALRESTDPEWDRPVSDADMAAHQRVVELFEPIAYLLTELIRSTAATGDAPTVSRGINQRISDRYVMGTAVPWAQFTSTSTDDSAALKFAGAAGTWFKMQVVNAASVSFCSPFPNERELLLPHGTITEVGFKFGGTLLMLLESQRDLVVVSEWSDNPRPTEETVKQRCRTLKDNAMLFEEFRERFVEPLCDVYEGDGKTALQKGVRLYRVFEDLLKSDQVHVMVLLGGGGIGKSSSLVALMHQASVAADWVPVFDGLHQIEGLLSSPGSPAKRSCYLEHLKRCVLQCRDASEALRLFLQRKVFHALDSLDEASGALPEGLPLLRSMGLDAGTSSKVAISTRPEFLLHRNISMRHLHSGALWRVELRGFDQSDIGRFAELTTLAWARGEEHRRKSAGCPSGQPPDVPAAKGRVARALRGLRAADEPLSRIPFVAKMVADLALAERLVGLDKQGGLKWRLVSEWGVLQVEQAAPRFPKLSRYDLGDLQAMAARVALAINSLLMLTAESQGVLAPFAAVLRCPSLLVEPDADGRTCTLQFNPTLGPEERAELADYLRALLIGVPPRRVRELLGVLPLRCEHLDSDRGMFSFRHKMVAEWMGALWFVASLRHSAPESVPSVLLRRFVHPHCIDSYQLVLAQTECDPSLAFWVRHRALQQPQQQQSAAGAHSGPPSVDADMLTRLKMIEQRERGQPMPPLVSDLEAWVRGRFAAAVMRHYDPARRRALTRRQMGTLWHVGVRGRADAPLRDDEWSAEHPIHGQHHPSMLRAVRLGGAEVHAAAPELTEEQLGSWMWGMLMWCTLPVLVEPKSPSPFNEDKVYVGFDLARQECEISYHQVPWLPRGLRRLWEMADAATSQWAVQRVAAQIIKEGAAWACVRNLSRRCLDPKHRNAEQLLWLARLLALSSDAEGSAHLLLVLCTAPFDHPQRRCYAAKPAAAFRAALCSCTATIAPADLSRRQYVGGERHPPAFFAASPGRRGDWGEVGLQLGGTAELLRREWVASLCAELRQDEGACRAWGEVGLQLGGTEELLRREWVASLCAELRQLPEVLDLEGVYPGAWQLELLRRAAQKRVVLSEVRAVRCDRFGELPVAAALLRLVAGCASVTEVSLAGSPVPEAVQRRLAAVLHLRGGKGLEGSILQAALLPAGPLEAGGALDPHTSCSAGGVNCSGEQLAASCAAARRNPLSIPAEVDASITSLTERDWEPLAALVCDLPSIARLTVGTQRTISAPRPSSAPLWVRNVMCAAICGRGGLFQDCHGMQGVDTRRPSYDHGSGPYSRTHSDRERRLAEELDSL